MLVDANPHGNHYYTTRHRPIAAIVVHITAGLEDLDATDDHSTEQTARYAASTARKVSWHYGTDTDSEIVLLPDTYTAWHCRNYNSSTLGHEISKRHTDWRTMPPVWVERTLHQAAVADAKRCAAWNIPVRHCTKGELDRAIANGGPPSGLIGHWELDPGRRSDPGLVGSTDTFPWDAYLALIRRFVGTTTPDPLEDPAMNEWIKAIKNAYAVFLLRNATIDELRIWLLDAKRKGSVDPVVEFIATCDEADKLKGRPSGDLVA